MYCLFMCLLVLLICGELMFAFELEMNTHCTFSFLANIFTYRLYTCELHIVCMHIKESWGCVDGQRNDSASYDSYVPLPKLTMK